MKGNGNNLSTKGHFVEETTNLLCTNPERNRINGENFRQAAFPSV